jgi:hypothetical protein
MVFGLWQILEPAIVDRDAWIVFALGEHDDCPPVVWGFEVAAETAPRL